MLEGADEFGAAVRIAGVVDGVGSDHDVRGAGGFGGGEGEREEEGVARGYVGDGDAGLPELVLGDAADRAAVSAEPPSAPRTVSW